MIHLPIAIIKGWKVSVGLFALSAIVLAAAEESSNRTLIIISAITSGTSLMGVLISGAISIWNARRLSVVVPKVVELAKNTDGMMKELQESRAETSSARQDAARSEGIIAGGEKEQARAASVPATGAIPSKVEIVQPPGKSVPVKPDKEP